MREFNNCIKNNYSGVTDNNSEDIIAHVKKNNRDEYEIQSLDEHSFGTAKRCSSFLEHTGFSETGNIIGLLHDFGKNSRSFQRYIRFSSGLVPGFCDTEEHSHSFMGSLLFEYGSVEYILCANAIAGHHRGLYDDNELAVMLSQKTISDYIDKPLYVGKISFPDYLTVNNLNHVRRVIYSALVDSDFLDTEEFMSEYSSSKRLNGKYSMQFMLDRLIEYMDGLDSRKSAMNANRLKLKQIVMDSDVTKNGVYRMTAATGTGKTLNTLLWALRHAVKTGKKRVIIAIPYTSVITQTAAVLKSIYGEEYILEHHSDFDFTSVGSEEQMGKYSAAFENWDFPVIVTTNVQLFESMYSNRSSVCRKLHNITDAVVILDEYQTIPRELLQPVIDAIQSYVDMGSTFLLASATPMKMGGEINGQNCMLNGFGSITDIIPYESGLWGNKDERVDVEFVKEPMNEKEIAQIVSTYDDVLCIVNTRSAAYSVYNFLLENTSDTNVFHLSKDMCAEHISDVLNRIKELKSKGIPVCVISTQLMEAGVDLDFSCVFRQEAGLDSIRQAAGRCNREGNMSKGRVFVFRLDSPLPSGSISLSASAYRDVSDMDFRTRESLEEYSRLVYSKTDNFDLYGMRQLLCTTNQKFESAANVFKMISDDSIKIIVPYKDGLEILRESESENVSPDVFRKLNRYAVNIYISQKQLEKMYDKSIIKANSRGLLYIEDVNLYNKNTGITL